jgi:hypothetical protein
MPPPMRCASRDPANAPASKLCSASRGHLLYADFAAASWFTAAAVFLATSNQQRGQFHVGR